MAAFSDCRRSRAAGNRHVFYRCGPGVLLIFNSHETFEAAGIEFLAGAASWHERQRHVCFRVSSNDIEAMAEKLRAADVAIEADFQWPNSGRSIYFRDPAGNSLECAEPRIWGI